jgi:4-hydroxybenzoate polyprenyltransferase
MTLYALTQLLRAHQWYKNLLIFLPLVFVQALFLPEAFVRVLAGFIALCMISSANYILNDIRDREADATHQEKRKRPLVTGEVNVQVAIVIASLLAITAFLIGMLLHPLFSLFVVLLFVLTQLYTFWLKYIPFLDILIIAVNFVLRAVSGAFIIYEGIIVRISPWLVLVPFFLAIFLVAAKRRAHYLFLGEGQQYNPTLTRYTDSTTAFLFTTSTTLLITHYALFTLFSDFPLLVVTLPIVLYAIYHFYHAVEQGSAVGRELSYAFLDIPLMSSLLLWTVVTGIIIYAL